MILPVRTAATTAALRLTTHLLVLGGGRSPIGGAPHHSMTLFTRYREDLGLRRSKTITHARRFSVGELGCLPPHNSAYSHLLALMHKPVPYRWAEVITTTDCGSFSSLLKPKIRNKLYY